jgi:predicted nuclease with TOPRIM domain
MLEIFKRLKQLEIENKRLMEENEYLERNIISLQKKYSVVDEERFTLKYENNKLKHDLWKLIKNL